MRPWRGDCFSHLRYARHVSIASVICMATAPVWALHSNCSRSELYCSFFSQSVSQPTTTAITTAITTTTTTATTTAITTVQRSLNKSVKQSINLHTTACQPVSQWRSTSQIDSFWSLSQFWACCQPIVSPFLNGDQRRKVTHFGPVFSQLLGRSSMEINIPK